MSIQFKLSTDTPEVHARLQRSITAVLDAHPLDVESDLIEALNEQWARITGRPKELRLSTAKAIVSAATDPTRSINDAFSDDGVVAQQTFYSKKKDWIHDPTYREILEIAIALQRQWDSMADTRKRNKRREDWQEKMYGLANDMADMGKAMLEAGLYERYEYEDDGKPVIILKPKYAVRDIAAIVPASDKLARLALDMHTDNTAVDVTAEVAEVDLDQVRKSMRDKLTKTRATLLSQIQPQQDTPEDDEDGANDSDS